MTFIGNYGLPDHVLIEKKIWQMLNGFLMIFMSMVFLFIIIKGREEGVLVHIFVSLTAPLFKWAAQSKLSDIYFK